MSAAIQWKWLSMSPRVAAHGLLPLDRLPSTSVSASGKSAQPVARRSCCASASVYSAGLASVPFR